MKTKNNGKTLNCKGTLISLEEPKVMGILNVTGDSFYAESRVGTALIDKAAVLLEEGAAFLDIGGQSTRPGSIAVGPSEETDRVVPVIEDLLRHFPQALLSVDTYHSAVASAAVKAGACIVNDISGGRLDEAMLSTVAALGVPYVAMHMQGTPETMQQDPHYTDVTREVLEYLGAVDKRATDAGIHDVILDPGFGFGKNRGHNYRLMAELDVLALLDRPILVGVSRKSMIYKTLGISPEEALNGTTVLHTVALMKGADILRVHDVREAIEAIRLTSLLRR